MECRELILSEMRFDPNVHTAAPEQESLEPDLVRAQRDINWAEHLVFGYCQLSKKSSILLPTDLRRNSRAI